MFVTASIGIALSGSDGDTPETLLRNADAAMYRAKERGRDRAELFDAQRAPPRGRRPAHRQRAAPRHRARRAARALPADDRPRHRHAVRLRGADPLGAPRARARAADGVRAARRGDRPHRAARRVGARAGVPAGGALARRVARRPAAVDEREPLAAPAGRAGACPTTWRACCTTPASSRRRSGSRSPRAR